MQKQKIASLFLMSLLAACTFEQQNGDLRATPAGIFADQSWAVTQQSEIPGGRLCTISAGEIDVVQQVQRGRGEVQVAVSRPLDPGSRYTIIVGSKRYETAGDYFSRTQSDAIVRDFASGKTAYSEWREFGDGNGRSWHWNTNKIPLGGFAPQYQACRKFTGDR
jgi:hypothetical protein